MRETNKGMNSTSATRIVSGHNGGVHSLREAFEYESDDWDVFKERLEGLLKINGHDGTDASDLAKKRAILLNVCSKKTYDLLRTLSAAKKPKEKTFAELCALLDG